MWNPFRCRHVGVAAREHGEWLGGLPLFLKLKHSLVRGAEPRPALMFWLGFGAQIWRQPAKSEPTSSQVKPA